MVCIDVVFFVRFNGCDVVFLVYLEDFLGFFVVEELLVNVSLWRLVVL